ncbi:MAG: PEGA domain-containing protein [Oleiphilaceae bacterium]|nr:PEGA domain-containing protein [Oleiphilaceae bacterium]
MVDLRPLLFINALMLMLLVSAGFVTHEPNTVGTEVPVASVPVADDEPEPARQTNQATTAAQVPEQTPTKPSEPETDQRLLTRSEAEAAVFADEAIFADSAPSLNNSAEQAALAGFEKDLQAQEPLVIGHKNTPKSKPIVTHKPKPLTTGKLIVRSNVHDDVVLVNGKPYGPTKLELELTPGSYAVEVAKPGYESWIRQVDIRRGQSQTLQARLEHYTSVEYVNGEWRHGVKTGEGRYVQEGVLEYNGSFVNGKFHGQGTIRYANGTKYQGEWFEGKMQGRGSFTTPEGDTYIGEMEGNKFNGEGTLTKATGDIYTGFWIDGVLNGQGSLTTKDGLLYVGGFSDNLFHGNGSLTYPDGGHYEGSFSNGMFHGKGVEIYPSGKKYVGQFIDGLYHGKGELLNPNGSKITGTFKDGKPFGKVTLTTAEGEVFTARSSEPGVCYRLKSYRATECPKLEGW